MGDSLLKLQQAELEILREFVSLCERSGLGYYLVGGTLLGAVRHGGFIPWDDDIDVAMPRPDYDRFLEIAPAQLKPGLFVQTFKTDKNYCYNFAKIRNSATYIEEKATRRNVMNQGIYIDIFPLDGFKSAKSGKPSCLIVHKMRCLWVKEFFIAKGCRLRPIHRRTFFSDLFIDSVALLFKPFNLRHHLNRHIERSLKKESFEKSRYAGVFFGQYLEREIFDKKVFGAGQKLSFSGLECRVPSDYQTYLSQIFGAYLDLPPADQRVAKHATTVDLEHSYLEHMKG